MGSSPRARGAASRAPRRRSRTRIIPARAGSRGAWRAPVAEPRDHPRARGEQRAPSARYTTGMGSSPRAGSRTSKTWVYYRAWDHPRARGAELGNTLGDLPGGGSSPRARGAGTRSGGGAEVYGIIPARAGSSVVWLAINLYQRDHPRARGEQIDFPFLKLYLTGSSPRARGAASTSV